MLGWSKLGVRDEEMLAQVAEIVVDKRDFFFEEHASQELLHLLSATADLGF
jgi:hypothetical protein